LREELPRGRAQRRVLAGHVPPVPHEPIAARAARIGETLVERGAQRAALRREPIDDDDVTHDRKLETPLRKPQRGRDATRDYLVAGVLFASVFDESVDFAGVVGFASFAGAVFAVSFAGAVFDVSVFGASLAGAGSARTGVASIATVSRDMMVFM